tara:strand:+ start:179 stop:382 length:204 start_codon:yes stop_codon:yes gene_type:complete
MEGTTEKVEKVIRYYKTEVSELMRDLECLIEDFEEGTNKERELEILSTSRKLKNRENIIEQLNKIKK